VSAPIGEVRVEVRGDTSRVDPDIEKGLRAAANDADPELKRIGNEFGNTISNAMEKEIEKHGPTFAHAVEKGTSRNPANIDWNLDTDRNTVQREVASLGRSLEREVRAVSSGGNSNNPFGAVGRAIADAVGAGFNISGKSPLIVALVPLFGFIAELVIGAVQAVNALSAALFVVPSLIGAIILQVGVLYIAFQGLGTAIQAAFAAKNADELKKALEGLTPATQEFVKTLLPLKDAFKSIRDIVQEQFFEQFGNSITVLTKRLIPFLNANLGTVAAALGSLARTIVTFFGDPAFTQFLGTLIPATINWIRELEPALSKFLFGLASIGTAVTPFLEWVGSSLTSSLATLGDWLTKLSSDPEFLKWLDDMKTTFNDLGKVIDSVAFFLFALTRAVDRAGGNKVLEDIANQLNAVATFLSTDLGTKAIEGLIHVVEFLAYSFAFLVLGVLALLTAFELILEFLRHGLWPWLTDFITNTIPEFFESVGKAIMGFFTVVGEFVSNYVKALGQAFLDIGAFILESLFNIGGWIATHVAHWIDVVIDFFSALPRAIWDALGDVGNFLFDAGKKLIEGLINGVKSMYSALGQAAHDAASVFLSFWPLSPAKEGPLSGKGDPMYAGQKLIDRLVTGMEMEQPALAAATNNMASTVVFGPNSVQANFNGQLPTNSQATALGGALGGGIAGRLAVRDTRLAVRAMA
jgi:hypothetical protein